MKLTKKQIEVIEKYLQKKGITYIDINHEILDHMILDVENLMLQNHHFERAFFMTSIKWEMHFRERKSFYFGFYFSNSKIVINKAAKVFKPFYFLYLACYFIPVFFIDYLSLSFNSFFTKIINNTTVFISGILLIYSILILFNIRKLKHKTVFSFIINTQCTGLLFLLLMFLLGDIVNEQGKFRPIFLGLTLAGFAVSFIIHHFYKKHKQVVDKYSLI